MGGLAQQSFIDKKKSKVIKDQEVDIIKKT